ncbi:n-acetylglucosamine-1-phosphotransferase subunits alpha beta-like [Nannochloropsis oceanica]
MEVLQGLWQRLDEKQSSFEQALHSQVKKAQRHTYTIFLRRPCLCLFFLLLLLVPFLNGLLLVAFGGCYHRNLLSFLARGEGPRSSWRRECTTRRFADNIAHKTFESVLSYDSIDVVYTWVNGSDPRWLAKKAKYQAAEAAAAAAGEGKRRGNLRSGVKGEGVPASTSSGSDGDEIPVMTDTESFSSFPSSSFSPWDEEQEEKPRNDHVAENRYRDSNELRFSLRSLDRFAPWVRKVYLVTDNQIPKWLALDNPRLEIIPHTAIFPNKSHLPVFSSPAIEAHLHRIPGLSQKFIYFNDDVFLAAPTYPEDFVSTSGVQKVYLSWAVPDCAPGCQTSWIGDGYCDMACNVTACGFDYPDCVNASSYGRCPANWVGDKICDAKCNNVACAFDGGDCGVQLIWGQRGKEGGAEGGREGGMEGGRVGKEFVVNALKKGKDDRTMPFFPFSSSFLESADAPVDGGTEGRREEEAVREVEYLSATHDNEALVQNAVLLKKHNLLLLLFPHDKENHVMMDTSTGNVTFTITGKLKKKQTDSRDAYIPFSSTPSPSAFTSDKREEEEEEEEEEIQVSFRLELRPVVLAVKRPILPVVVADGRVRVSALRGYAVLTGGGAVDEEEGEGEGEGEDSVGTIKVALHPFPLLSSVLQDTSIATTTTTITSTVESQPSRPPSLPTRLAEGIILTFSSPSASPSSSPSSASSASLSLSPHEEAMAKVLVSLYDRTGETLTEETYPLSSLPPSLPPSLLEEEVARPLFWSRNEEGEGREGGKEEGRVTLLVPFAQEMEGKREWTHGRATLLLPSSSPLVRLSSATKPRGRKKDKDKASAKAGGKRSDGSSTSRSSTLHPSLLSAEFFVYWGNSTQVLAEGEGVMEGGGREEEKEEKEEGEMRPFDLVGSSSRYRRRLLSVSSSSSSSSSFSSSHSYLPQHAIQLLGDEDEDRREEGTEGLSHVNRLYHKAFGPDARKVPAHMPHMIDKGLVEEMQARWKQEWDATSSHRFRSPKDMQYSFSFYYYLMNLHKAHPLDMKAFWHSHLDLNRDGYLDDNELITLAALGMGGDPTYEYLMEIKGCMLEGGRDGGKERGGSGWRRRLGEMMGIEVGTEGAPWHAAIKEEGEEGDGEEGGQGEEAGSSGDSNPVSVTPIPSSSSSSSSTSSSSSSSIATAMDSKGREDKEEEENGKYRRISQEGDPRVTLESFLSCPKVQNDLQEHVRRKGPWIPGQVEEVTFQMLSDDIDQTRKQLNTIRAKRTKFVCLNDDVKSSYSSHDTFGLLQNFFLSLFPDRCQFELPLHLENRFLYLDEYHSASRKLFWVQVGLALSFLLLLLMTIHDCLYPSSFSPRSSLDGPQEEEGEDECKGGGQGGKGEGAHMQVSPTKDEEDQQRKEERERVREREERVSRLTSASPLLAASSLLEGATSGRGGGGEGAHTRAWEGGHKRD